MAFPQTQFDDPALKSALQRVWGGDAASPALRRRIEKSLDQQKWAEQSILRRWRAPLTGLAAAAVLAVVFSMSAVVATQNRDRTVPTWFADAVVAAHDRCVAEDLKNPEAHGRKIDFANRDEVRAVRSSLNRQIGYPVMVYSPGKDWKLDGARVCTVGNIPAAHLMFTRGKETLSIFSISAGALYNDRSVPDGVRYAQVDKGHGVAGFTYGGALHCVVGNSPEKSNKVELAAVTAVRDMMFASHPLSVAPDVGAVFSGK
jgi:hypothetical protein